MPTEQARRDKQRLRRTLDNLIRVTSSVGEGTEFTGSFRGGENIVIRGCVRGESDVSGVVVIEHSGQWIGKLTADVVVIAGNVEGDVIARDKIEITAGARVLGNLKSPRIAIERGAIHEGTIHMRENTSLTRFEERRSDPLVLSD
jgi:cytoskeletal protein CcmA (bactofilin family)